jgi:phosphohistidine phosphatase
MTRTLILIRHAKSDWDDPALSDHDRPLNARGQRSAPRIGAWLAEQGVTPDAVLCSTALRTRETWDGIATQLPEAPEPVFSHGLYHAAPIDMLNAIRDSDATCWRWWPTIPGSARSPGRSAPSRPRIRNSVSTRQAPR